MQESVVTGYRLSPQQRRLWSLMARNGAQSPDTYHAEGMIEIRGDLCSSRLRDALRNTVRRHEILRTTFRYLPEMNIPLQVICPEESAGFERLPAALERPLDLQNGPTLSATLISQTADHHLLHLRLPALCADYVTLDRLAAELGASYTALSEAGSPEEPELQYADFAAWQNELLESEETTLGRDYWRQKDLQLLSRLRLPLESPKPAGIPFAPERQEVVLSPEVAAGVEILLQEGMSSEEAVLLAVWLALLHRLTGEEVAMVTVCANGRQHLELENALGLFMRYVPVGIPLNAELSVREVVLRTARALEEARKWQEYFSWEMLETAPTDEAALPAPFAFDWHEEGNAHYGDGVSFRLVMRHTCVDRFRIRLSAVRGAAHLALTFHYDPDCFAPEYIRRLAEEYQVLLRSACAYPEEPLSRLEIVGEEDLRLLRLANETASEYPRHRCIHHLFEDAVQRCGDRPAVVFEEEVLTYRELDRKAEALAATLRQAGVGADVVVGLHMERSARLLVGLMGILKAGGAYLPLDPAMPRERLELMLSEARVGVLVTETRFAGAIRTQGIHTVLLDAESETVAPEEPCGRAVQVTSTADLAYVLFTSGTTGRPKGVAIEHRQLVNYTTALLAQLGNPENASFAMVTSFGTDLGNTAVFGALCSGGCLHVIASEQAVDPDALGEYFTRWRIDCLKIVPSHLLSLLHGPHPEQVLPCRFLVLGGEACPWDLVDRVRELAPECRVYNHYGPTETTVGALIYPVPSLRLPLQGTTVPIGRPIANTAIYILDSHGVPVPVGVPGELYLGGDGLARGYLHQPELTSERFVTLALETAGPETAEPVRLLRLYRTGDRVRMLAGGILEFLGRMDRQVKLRGFRLELEEIEAIIRSHPDVEQAAVEMEESASGEPVLVAYLVPDNRTALPVRRLLDFKRSGSAYVHRLRRLPHGAWIVHNSSSETDYLYRQIYVEHTYLQHGITIENGDCVLDIGAHLGLFSLFVGERWPGARIYALEPIPQTFELLRLNVALNGISAHLFNCGVSDRSGDRTFTHYQGLSLLSGLYADIQEDEAVVRAYLRTSQLHGDKQGEMIDELLSERLAGERVSGSVIALTEFLQEQGIESVGLLKLDVQKSEIDALAGIAEKDWPKIRQIVIEIHDLDGQLSATRRLLEARGFEVTTSQEPGLSGTVLHNLFAIRIGTARTSNAVVQTPPYKWRDPQELTDDLRRFAQDRLPGVMVPSDFVLLDSLPLTPSGKIDYRALQRPREVTPPGAVLSRSPSTPVEELVALIWQDVLGRSRIGTDEDFFSLGGHSLLATQLVSRLREAFQVPLPLRELFAAPTIGGVAHAITLYEGSAGQAEQIARLTLRVRAMPPEEVDRLLQGR